MSATAAGATAAGSAHAPGTASGTSAIHASQPAADRAPAGFVLTPSNLLTGGLLGLAFVALFHHWFYVQNFQSWTHPDWTHAYFVPQVSLYILWRRRADLAATPVEIFWPGILPLLLGINTYLFFKIGPVNNHMAQGWSMVLTLFGLCLLLGGTRMMKVLFFPIAYLIFGITISDPIMQALTVPLKSIASGGGWFMLNLIGVTCERDGNVLTVATSNGPIPLDVAEACAGMRMVIGFIALGAAVSIVATNLWWKRTALFVLGVPLAILMNVLRVAVLGVLTLYEPNLAKGESHMFMGTIILAAAFFVYMGIVWALNKAVPEGDEHETAGMASASSVKAPAVTLQTLYRPYPAAGKAALWRLAFALPMAILSMAAVVVPAAVMAMGIHLQKRPISAEEGRVVGAIPVETPTWKRIDKDRQESSEVVEELGTTNYLTRAYARKGPAGESSQVVQLHLAYYTGMIDTIPHIPERCMVGGGWEITGDTRVLKLVLDQSTWRPEQGSSDMSKLVYALTDRSYSDLNDAIRVRLPSMPDGISLRTTEFTQPKVKARQYAGYFFIANGTVTDSADKVRLLAFDLRDNYAYYLKVQFSSATASSAEELAEQAGSLLSELLPEIMRCVPDWSKVEAGTYPPDNPKANKIKGST